MDLAQRLAALDWRDLRRMLDEQGFAALPKLLDAEQCEALMEAYRDESRFRSTVDMARYRFGSGTYKYYGAPLPPMVQQLREGLYPGLAEITNEWRDKLGAKPDYPETLQDFLEQCHQAGQQRPTPLILRYESGGYNCLHQDLYGEVYFPFQVVFALNQRERNYTGGEFLLVEQRPRAQSRGHAIALEQGGGLIFPTQQRPVAGTRGYYRTQLRHGVSTVTSGTRYSLGVIFHDAK